MAVHRKRRLGNRTICTICVVDPVVRLSLTALSLIGMLYAAVSSPDDWFWRLSSFIASGILPSTNRADHHHRGHRDRHHAGWQCLYTERKRPSPQPTPGRIGAGAAWGHAVAGVFAIVFLSVVFWVGGSLVMVAVRRLKPVSHPS